MAGWPFVMDLLHIRMTPALGWGKDREGATGIPPAETLRENCCARSM